MKNLQKLGKALNKAEQKQINGGEVCKASQTYEQCMPNPSVGVVWNQYPNSNLGDCCIYLT